MHDKKLIINKYDLYIEPSKDFQTFNGIVEISLNINEQISKIEFDSVGLKIKNCEYFNVVESKWIEIDFETTNTHLILKQYSEFKKENDFTFKINFKGKILKDLKGLYSSKYIENNQEKVLLSTQFEPTDARKAFPCIDNPSYKAKFNLSLIIPKDLNAISNMPIKEKKERDHSSNEIIFEETPIMSTYLLFFAIGKIKSKEITTKNNILIRVWATNNQEDFGEFALETSEKLLDYFESYFGTKYPLPKLDHIAIPDFAAGAMENWGCISYRENALLVDPENSSIQTKQLVAAIIAHEMAHMWFGDLVTMNWWNDLWLNESFASWMGDKAISKLFPEWDIWTKFLLDDTNRAFELDALDSSHPIEQEVKNPDEIGQLFDAISYSKGASLIRMLENYIGEDPFRNGIQKYINKHQYSNTVTNDLWNALSESSNKDIQKLMKKWTTEPGFPLVEVSMSDDNVIITQKKFSYNPENNSDSNWIIPVKYKEKNAEKQSSKTMLIESSESIIEESDISIFNSNSSGFYKTIYSEEIFNNITDMLKDDMSSLMNEERLGLLSDTYTLLKSSKIDPENYLSLLKIFSSETNPYIWKYICGSLRSLDSKLYKTPIYDKYYSFTSNIFNNLSIDLNWNIDHISSEIDQIMVGTLIENSCYYNIDPLIKKSLEIFRNSSKYDKTEIHPNLKRPLFLSVAYNGDKNDFDKIWKLYLNSNSQEEKSLYLGSLTQFNNIEKINFLLSQITTENIRKHDIASVLIGIANNNIGFETSWSYLKENWSKILEIAGDGFQLNYIVSLPSNFQTKSKFEEIENYYNENPVDAASMSMNQTLEKIQNNIKWVDINLEKFEKYL